jgi:hypothetical protein
LRAVGGQAELFKPDPIDLDPVFVNDELNRYRGVNPHTSALGVFGTPTEKETFLAAQFCRNDYLQMRESAIVEAHFDASLRIDKGAHARTTFFCFRWLTTQGYQMSSRRLKALTVLCVSEILEG